MKMKCSGCGALLAVRAEMGGKRFKCPKCGAVMTAPTQGAAPARDTVPEPAVAPPRPARRPRAARPAPRKPGMAGRIGSIFGIPSGALLAIFFFLPWLKLSCDHPMSTREIGKASGFQLAKGDMSEGSDLEKIRRETEKKNAARPPSRDGRSTAPKKTEDKLDKDKIKPRPWAWAGIGVPVLIALAGLLGLSGGFKPAQAGMALLILAVLGLGATAMVFTVDYAKQDMKESAAKKPTPTKKDREKYGALANEPKFTTEPTGIVFVCLGLYVLVAAGGVANLALGKR